MSSIAHYRETLQRWGLSDVPFRATPPEDPVQLSRIFYGRQRELDLALPALYEGRNVLVRGLWGVGKTTFILRLLHRLQQETAALGERMLILYVGRFPGETSEALYGALLPLSETLVDAEPEARRVRDVLSGLRVTHSRQLQVEGKVDLQLVSIGGSWERGREEGWQLQNVYTVLLRLLDVAQEQYGRVIVAVDDLDKKEPRGAGPRRQRHRSVATRAGQPGLSADRSLHLDPTGRLRADVGPVQRDYHTAPDEHRRVVSHCRQLSEHRPRASIRRGHALCARSHLPNRRIRLPHPPPVQPDL
ncbi:MAG: ATP-binding protein [Anaerolineae bacterium]|nr:ATP-binding protein [Anaerolineae bacterium]